MGVRWTGEELAAVMAALERSAAALRAIPDAAILDAWSATVEAFLDPASPERLALAAPLAAACALSPPGLDAALAAVLGGVRRRAAAAMFERATALCSGAGEGAARQAAVPTTPVLVVLASNLPGLAVQPLLPCLVLRRPVLLKSPSAEPHFAPAFLGALVRREPRLANSLAAATWSGGDAALEAPVLAAAATVLAYGGAAAIADLERRAAGRIVTYGPKTSFAVLDGLDAADCVTTADSAAAETAAAPATAIDSLAAALARDIALFDQRGCLSLAAIYLRGDVAAAARLAAALEAALAALAARWPPGPAPAEALAAVQHARLEAAMRGLPAPRLPIAAGTVLVEPEPRFQLSPGLRTVRIHPLADLEVLPDLLAPWAGRLQGAALAGPAAWALAPRLTALAVSRFAAPGELQSPDAAWHNGGVDPLEALAI